MKIRTVIVDDEPLARERIRDLLRDDPQIEVIGEYGSGRTALAGIQKLEPQLLFLDVQMPGLDGFGVLAALEPGHIPVTVFVTAYDRYALRAFEVCAVDYLLKPFDRQRFGKALRRAKAWVLGEGSGDVNRKLLALLDELKPPPRPLERLVVNTRAGPSSSERRKSTGSRRPAITSISTREAKPISCGKQ